MVNTFASLKKSRTSQIEKLNQELAKMSGGQNQSSQKDDERFWQPTVDKTGNGYAVIRFLPAPKNEEVPFVRVFSHGFKGPTGSWYIENSLTTLGQNDPVSDYNTVLWNSGSEADKQQAREQKRRLHFYSNILVVNDPGNPENNGKVFIFRYGKKIFDKLNDLMSPEFEDEEPVNPFCMWEGANFKLKIRQVEGYRNYDKSEFDKPSPVAKSDKEMEEIWEKEYSLQEFISPSNFKSYDELKTKLDRVLGLSHGTEKSVVKSAAPVKESTDVPWDDDTSDLDSDDIDSILKKIEKDD